VEGGGVEPDKCSRSKRSSLELACSSRTISRISYSTTGCQLSYSCGEDCVYDNQRRQQGSEDRNSDLLIELEGWAPKEVDMVITRVDEVGRRPKSVIRASGRPAMSVIAPCRSNPKTNVASPNPEHRIVQAN